jgi:quinol monooxygenase YgiN
MLIVIGSARAAAHRRADLVAAAREVVAATRADGGCLAYGFYADLDDENTIVNVEMWRDQAALDAHMTHAHTTDFLARVGGLVHGTPSVVVHRIRDATDTTDTSV